MSYNNQSISIRLHIKTGDSLWSAVWCLFQRVGGNIGHQLPETTFRRLGCLVLALLSLQLSGKNPFLIRSQKSHQPSISFHFLDNSSLGCQENIFNFTLFLWFAASSDVSPWTFGRFSHVYNRLSFQSLWVSCILLPVPNHFWLFFLTILTHMKVSWGGWHPIYYFFHSIYYPIYYGK